MASDSKAETVLGNSIVRWLGDISFTIYLLHIPTIDWVTMFGPSDAPQPVAFAVILVVTLIASTFLPKFLEKPERQAIPDWGRRFT